MTYLNIVRQLLLCKVPLIPQKIYSAFSFTLCVVALRFKASFTSADAPELLIGLPRAFLFLINGSSLIDQARGVFLGIGTIILVAVIAHIYQRFSMGKRNEGKTELGAFEVDSNNFSRHLTLVEQSYIVIPDYAISAYKHSSISSI